MKKRVQSLDLPKNTIKELQKLGFYNCDDVSLSLPDIEQKMKIPNWPKVNRAPVTKSAFDLLRECDNTGISFLDGGLNQIFEPHLRAGSITELCGMPGSGRTQICFHLCGANPGHTFFISTNKNLPPHRLKG